MSLFACDTLSNYAPAPAALACSCFGTSTGLFWDCCLPFFWSAAFTSHAALQDGAIFHADALGDDVAS